MGAYAIVCQLVNEWRRGSDPVAVAQLEETVVKSLTASRNERECQALEGLSAGEARLLVKVMTNKLNEKYGKQLCEEQRSLLKAYMVSSDDLAPVRSSMNSIKRNLERTAREYSGDELQGEKLHEVREMLSAEDVSAPINDDMLKRFMNYASVTAAIVSDTEANGGRDAT